MAEFSQDDAISSAIGSPLVPWLTLTVTITIFIVMMAQIGSEWWLLSPALCIYLVTADGHEIADWGNTIGNLLIIGAAMGYSVYTVLIKQILHHK